MVRVYIAQLKILFVRLEDDQVILRVHHAYLLHKRPLPLAPSVRDKDNTMSRGEFGQIYRLEQAQEHKLTIILAPYVVAHHRKLQIRFNIHNSIDSSFSAGSTIGRQVIRDPLLAVRLEADFMILVLDKFDFPYIIV